MFVLEDCQNRIPDHTTIFSQMVAYQKNHRRALQFDYEKVVLWLHHQREITKH